MFITLDELRTARDAALQRTDFLVLPDIPLTQEEKTVVLLYRQNLRDLLSQYTAETVSTAVLPLLSGTNIEKLLK